MKSGLHRQQQMKLPNKKLRICLKCHAFQAVKTEKTIRSVRFDRAVLGQFQARTSACFKKRGTR